jgi:hypothetical protein
VWDNVLLGTAISSPAIEASLTMPTIAGRVLGLSEKGEAPATTIQFFTGNNIAPAGDMASRSFVIPLDVGRPDPENREFKHPDPYRWTLDHRGAILRALYKLLVWNLQRGADRSNAKTRFKQWWALCGAPIEALAGVDLARILTSRESEDTQVTALAMLLGSLRTQFGEQYFTAQEVKDFGDSSDISDRMPGQSIRGLLEEATSKPFPRHVVGAGPWGQRLGMIVGKPVAIDDSVLTLERLADSKRGHAYKIKIGSR